MNGMFTKKSRGLRSLDKYLHIAYCTKDYNSDFVVISEIGRRYFLSKLINLAKDNPYPVLIGGLPFS
jgi:hypothetical protein